MAEVVPIGTILAVLTSQITKTAQAAMDVVFEKESFKVLAKHLFDIERVLKELQLKQLNDSPSARHALESLETDVKRANNLVKKYKNRARFYLLIKCRHIVKEVQDVTRDIGKALAALSLANIELLSGISDQVNKLQMEMQKAELEASQSQLQILDKLNQGLSDQAYDQDFANDLLKEIAMAVGVPVEPAQISKELESFKREKEEAAYRKERAEVFFLEQVIELLSRADAARDYEEVRNQYFQRFKLIERYEPRDEYIEPLKAFLCCITGELMTDPVSLCTGTACERAAIQAWFVSGEKTDPKTGVVLEDLSYRSNLQVRHSIQEWKELNYCVKIRSCKEKLMSLLESSVEEALCQMQEIVRENSINKDWVSIGGLTEIVISMLGDRNNEGLKTKMLFTLKDIINGHARNKEIFVENQGIEKVIPYLGSHSSISKPAVELLYEVLQDRSGWNLPYTRRLANQCDSIPLLVGLHQSSATEIAQVAENILFKLCDDDGSVIQAAKAKWFIPLIDRIIRGSSYMRMSMVRAVVGLELNEDNMKLLGKEGIIAPLIEMASGNIESKELALHALVKISSCSENKKLIADAGGVPLVLKLTFSPHMPALVLAKSAEILANLLSGGDGTKYLVDEMEVQIDLEFVITNLLALQQNLNTSDIVRRPALRALLGICRSQAALVKSAVLSANGISVILQLLDESNQEIRELAINLLFLFSQHEPQEVVEYLLKPRRLEAIVGFLDNWDNNDVQMAAAGLLANLPKSETSLTKRLIELGGLKAIISILKSGTMEAKENALSALFRFTDPTNLESQSIVVQHGTFPLLINLLKVESTTAKARAAALLGDLSMRSPELTGLSKNSPSCWFMIRKRHVRKCPAHGGPCSLQTTFCLLEANALHDLVTLLQEQVHATAYEAIQTLSTLVHEEFPHRGANVLHENAAIRPIIQVLSWGSESLKAEALALLEKLFVSKEMVDFYGPMVKLPLGCLTGRSVFEEGHLQRKAARVLLLIERYSRSSRSLVAGISS